MRKGQLATNGFSLVEVILASAIFVLLVTTLIGAYIYGQESTVQAGNRSRAVFLAEEGLSAVHTIRDDAWNELYFEQTGLNTTQGYWSFSGEDSIETIGDFTRTLTFNAVCRNELDAIAACPANRTDAHTKQVTSTVWWDYGVRGTTSISSTGYITNWDSQDWTQTDWSGGSGQSLWSNPTRYESDDANIHATVSGQLQLAAATENWVLAAGAELGDTTEADFGAGTHSQTVVDGTGTNADVVLNQTQGWVQHADSGVVSQNLLSIDALSGTDMWAVGAAGKILHYNGSSWLEFADLGTNINGVDMVSSTDGWAVGASGKVWRYNGTTWSETIDFGSSSINDVVMLSATDGYAVGDSSKFYRYNGTSWSEVIDLGSSTVFGLSMVSSTDGWAVGASGKFYRYNGTSWSEFVDIGGTQMNDVFMVSSTDGWAVGSSGTMYRYNGTTWATVTSPVTTDLNRIHMLSGTDGWAVGASGKILHWNGTAWSESIDIGGTALNGMIFVNATNGWVVGNSGMIQQYLSAYYSSGTFHSRVFDGGAAATWSTIAWTEALTAGSDITIATRSGNTPTPDGSWSSFSSEQTEPLGSDISSPTAQYIQYRITFTRGTSAIETPRLDDVAIIYNSPTGKRLTALSTVTEDDMWAVGDSGTIVHYDGSAWQEHANSALVSQSLEDVVFNSPIDGWAVGGSGKFLHYNGTSWSEFIDTGSESVNALAFFSATDGWAVGNSGKVWRYNGTAWSEFTDLGSNNIFDISMISGSDVWAVGATGKIYHYNGTAWSQSADVGTTINALDMVSGSDGWAVGDSGKVYHYNGTSWSEFVDTGSTQLNGVSMVSSTLGWAVGNGGLLYKYNGSSWTSTSSPTNKDVTEVGMLTSVNGWAVGAGGSIIHFIGGGAYATQGMVNSSAFNAGVDRKIQVVEWDEDLSACTPDCVVRVQLRVALDSSGLPGTWSDWYGAAGSGTYFTTADGSLIPTALNDKQWIQYRVELIGDGTTTPILNELRINYK